MKNINKAIIMKIILIEPFFGGSHKQWANDLIKHLPHEFYLLTLPERWWKWRMYGGAITLANKFMQSSFSPDLIITSDMLDLTTFKALVSDKLRNTPIVIYFHENQFAYPERPDYSNREDYHYRFINYTSALTANRVLFNSKYNMDSFFMGLNLLF